MVGNRGRRCAPEIHNRKGRAHYRAQDCTSMHAGGHRGRGLRDLLRARPDVLRLLNQLGAEVCEFLIANRSRFFQTVKLFDFVGDTETNGPPDLLARL